ncbi:MAG: hypothetical protein EOR63_32450 [Mesorhizobium sp.]|nr:MAG: hypothetical protein EOR63_32450 [Mesorhizobium sp.]
MTQMGLSAGPRNVPYESTLDRLEKGYATASRRASVAKVAMFLSMAAGFAALMFLNSPGNVDSNAGKTSFLVVALLQMFGMLALWQASMKRKHKAYDALDLEHSRKVVGRKWETPAGAVGHAIQASQRGQFVLLAFPTGIVGEYFIKHLKPASDRAKDVQASG